MTSIVEHKRSDFAPYVARPFSRRERLKRIIARTEAVPILALLLLPVLCFHRAALCHAVFAALDVKHYFVPYHALAARVIKSGELPLWNPYAFGGMPLFADGQTAVLYPPNWLFLVLPPWWAMNFAILAQFWIAGVGFYWMARQTRLCATASLLGALSFSLSGFLVARVVHLSIMSGAALLPVVFLCFSKALRTAAPRWYAAAGVMIAMQVFTGHPQPVIYTAFALALYVMVIGLAERRLVRMGLHAAGIYIVGFALSAVQLLPWIELGNLSPRAAFASPHFLYSSASRLPDLLLMLFPYMFGSLTQGPFESEMAMTGVNMIRLWEHSAYIGIIPLAFAVIGILRLFADDAAVTAKRQNWKKRRALLVFFALLALLGTLLATVEPLPVRMALSSTPVLNKLRNPERASMLIVFACAMLAAISFHSLLHRSRSHMAQEQSRVQLKACAGWLVAMAGVAYLITIPSVYAHLGLTAADIERFQVGSPNWLVPVGLSLTSAVLLLLFTKTQTRLVLRLMVVLACADLVLFASSFQPLASPTLFSSKPAVTRALDDTSDLRVATVFHKDTLDSETSKHTLAVSWNVLFGYEGVNGFNSLQTRRHMDIIFGPKVEDVSYGMLPWEKPAHFNAAILGLFSVGYVIVPNEPRINVPEYLHPIWRGEHAMVYRVTDACPRAYFPAQVKVAHDHRAVLESVRTPSFNPRQVTWIEDPPGRIRAGMAYEGNESDKVYIVGRRNSRLELEAVTSRERFLATTETYFPGWEASIDGVPTHVVRTNYLFRGVFVPAGKHRIVFDYKPPTVAIGGSISLVAVLVCSLALAYRLKWRYQEDARCRPKAT